MKTMKVERKGKKMRGIKEPPINPCKYLYTVTNRKN
jgi:hypothetical protein